MAEPDMWAMNNFANEVANKLKLAGWKKEITAKEMLGELRSILSDAVQQLPDVAYGACDHLAHQVDAQNGRVGRIDSWPYEEWEQCQG